MTRSLLIAALGAMALASPLLLAQGQSIGSAQATGQPQTPPKSTAFILGQVLDGTTGQPIAEAIVTLRLPARGGGAGRGAPAGNPAAAIAMEQAMALRGRGGSQEQRLITGGDGKFVFHSLPPGNYTITATLNGYSSSLAANVSNQSALIALAGLSLPSTGPTSPTTVSLTEGQHLSDFKLRLWKNAAIVGTVLDDGGEPAIGLTVQAMSRIVVAGRARYLPVSGGRTDDRGVFRIASLKPGDYVVVIPQAPAAVPAAMMDSMMKGVFGGGDMSSVLGIADLAMSGVNVGAAMQGGVRLGNYMVASASGAPPILAADGRLFVYQTMFYPGVGVPVQAEVLTLKSGEERAEVNFQLRLTPTAKVSGIATGPTGPMANLGMRLVVPADGVTSDSEFDVATVVTGPDGSFTFFGVPPGQFLLRAQKEGRANTAENAAMMAMMGMGRGAAPPGPAKSVFGQATIAVGSTDVEGVVFQLAEGVTVGGRMEFTSATGRAQPPQLTNIQVRLLPADGRSSFRMGGAARVTASGAFETVPYGPGKYFLQIDGVPGPWQVKSATVGGRDVLDAAVDVRDANIGGVVVTVTDEAFSLTGTVTPAAGQTVADAVVLLFPADYRAWIENGMNPRRSRSGRPNPAGAYTFPVLPAGDYLVVAVDRSDEGNLQDPAYIEALSRLGTRVSVVSAKQTLDLSTMKVKR